MQYVSYVRTSDKACQFLVSHLLEVSEICKSLASKINAAEAGELIGLMHDFGKYSGQYQHHVQTGLVFKDPDCDTALADAKGSKCVIDHSSAGAQWIWQELSKYGRYGEGKLCGQILALCVASHHSGLIDCLKPDGKNGFRERINKSHAFTNFEECTQNAQIAGKRIMEQARKLADKPLLQTMLRELKILLSLARQHNSRAIKQFYLGFWTRFLLSCLIDADRINSVNFEKAENYSFRHRNLIRWVIPISRLETYLDALQVRHDDDHSSMAAIRRKVSDTCKNRAGGEQGVFTLTVPTGGGKTLTSLRFALHHAHAHKLERIIYVLPYTTIIEQTAETIRKVVEHQTDSLPWVFEHHGNLESEMQTWLGTLSAETWDAPIVLTDMAQFLDTLFGGGTRGARRMHQLANSVVVFDEIQTLPIQLTHLLCNAINFFSFYASTTIVLCSATHTLLDKLRAPEKGQLWLSENHELTPEAPELFRNLELVEIRNKTKTGGWSEDEIVDLALAEFHTHSNCLLIVNTPAWGQNLYMRCIRQVSPDSLFHVSAMQCPAHRRELLQQVRWRLQARQPVLCISTRMMESGVDIDFACVIRFLAGMDSIIQSSGRCNRNGYLPKAIVHIVNPADEDDDLSTDIRIGREISRRVLDEIYEKSLLEPDVMALYFKYYFFDRVDEMVFPLKCEQTGKNDSMLNLLSDNRNNFHEEESMQLRQSFMAAAEVFRGLDAPMRSVIAPYQQGKQLTAELRLLAKRFDTKGYRASLARAREYSVNLFPREWEKLTEQNAVREINLGEGVYCLDERYYSAEFGLSTEIFAKADISLLYK